LVSAVRLARVSNVRHATRRDARAALVPGVRIGERARIALAAAARAARGERVADLVVVVLLQLAGDDRRARRGEEREARCAREAAHQKLPCARIVAPPFWFGPTVTFAGRRKKATPEITVIPSATSAITAYVIAE